MENSNYGINIRRYCREHEAAIRAAMAAGSATPALIARHGEMLRRLQHERLIHLIVLVMTVMAELFTVDMAVLHPETNPLSAIVMLALAVLLAFYFRHYFFLENTVQRWYALGDALAQLPPQDGETSDSPNAI